MVIYLLGTGRFCFVIRVQSRIDLYLCYSHYGAITRGGRYYGSKGTESSGGYQAPVVSSRDKHGIL